MRGSATDITQSGASFFLVSFDPFHDSHTRCAELSGRLADTMLKSIQNHIETHRRRIFHFTIQIIIVNFNHRLSLCSLMGSLGYLNYPCKPFLKEPDSKACFATLNKPLNLLEKILINHQDTNYLYTMS